MEILKPLLDDLKKEIIARNETQFVDTKKEKKSGDSDNGHFHSHAHDHHFKNYEERKLSRKFSRIADILERNMETGYLGSIKLFYL